ncbi:MAG: metallophosphoesterase [Clostridia bacterium]|nr:metallophosphoesterase [Clostridia bacterium]
MKKKGKIILCAVLAVLIVAGAVTWCFLPHPLSYPINSIEPVGSHVTVTEDSEDSVTVCKESEGDFKILMFTDLHLDGKNATSQLTVSHLVENIQREQPDLVLLGGDNVTSGLNRLRAKQLGRIFEKLGVYWAGVLGNHEGDNPWSITRTEMVEIFSSFDHCLMRPGPAQVGGDCNYALKIVNTGGQMLETFFFLDTFDEMSDAVRKEYAVPEDASEYDGAHADQVAWFTAKAAEIKQQFGDYHAAMVMHIPLPQVAAAAEAGNFSFGGKLENVCCTGFDSGLFDAAKAAGVEAVFCGHDHLNNFGVMYENVLLSYIEPSGYGSYTAASRLGYEEKDWLQGYTLLTIHANGSFSQQQIRNSENATGEGA